FVGFQVVWNVTPALHTPLMSVTNAISSIIMVGAMLAAGAADLDWGGWLGVLAVALVSINTFGGFLVTRRMLEMFRKKEPKPVALRAVCIATAVVNSPAAMELAVPIAVGHKIELFIGTFIGAVTFSGSVIAFGKLSGTIRSAPVAFAGQHYLNLAIGLAMIGFGIGFCMMPAPADWGPFIVMTIL